MGWQAALGRRVATISILLLILVLGAALRAEKLGRPIYSDEIVTVTVAARPLADMPRVMRLIDASPALYPALLHVWLRLGRSDAGIRLLSALIGTLTVLAAFALARSLLDTRAALASAWVVAIAPPQIYYAQYVRGYSLFTLLAVLQIWLLWRALEAEAGSPGPFWKRWGPVAVLTAAMLYTHYLASLIVAAEVGFLAVSLRRYAPALRAWLGAMVVAGLLFAPALPLLLHNLSFDRARNLDRPAPPSVVVATAHVFADLSLGDPNLSFANARHKRSVLVAAMIAFPVLAALGAVYVWRLNPRALLLLLFCAAGPVLLYVFSGRKLIHVRFFLPSGVAYAVCIGAGLSALRRWAFAGGVAALTILAAIPLFHYYRDFSWSYDHAAVARRIAAASQPGDILLFVQPYEQFYFEHYLDSRLPMEGLPFTALRDQRAYVIKPPAVDLSVAIRKVTDLERQYRRFWVIGQSTRSFSSDAGHEQALFAWLDGRYRRAGDANDLTGGDPQIRLYTFGPAPESRTAIARPRLN